VVTAEAEAVIVAVDVIEDKLESKKWTAIVPSIFLSIKSSVWRELHHGLVQGVFICGLFLCDILHVDLSILQTYNLLIYF